MQIRSDTLVALGSNQQSSAGTPEETLKRACALIADSGVVIRAISRFYATPCFPAGAGPDYVNAAINLEWSGSPEEMLATLHRIEADLGRARVHRWGQRTVDLDLIAVGDRVLPDAETYAQWRDLPLEEQRSAAPDQLVLPHPRMQDRAFVLVPLADVAPDWVHPLSGLSVIEMRDALNAADLAEVRPL
ncbi:2-amino-4-hydroxy-6-hydroxymethyldihydropteridine diphosphokinase [Photobacterium sp. TY 1-4]|uniref:2-amino-4-hydroxy-6-hydroxymethyldihydropteridine pyrophosphokinase n=2 Tax=Pseudosulfitobacter koreensis TaxID=2968472 RepID=A0ABT1YVP4_9RHOB|nr:2-amino-4-hydroxy-6-hydroxymethyldihydropteridine diphosphokinase [Pseudosulfitobacter koreense]MCR8824951.1 2-amino-4-hydroxy-6-hydroxymethyldihydropteridine diphosphokinase [Pseudosulfitobacter koreense]